MKRKTVVLFFALASTCILLSGCGEKNSNDNTNQAIAKIQNGDTEEGMTLLGVAEEEGEDAQQIERAKGIAYLADGDYEDAISSLELSLSKASFFPDELEYDTCYYLAAAYYHNGETEDAENVYDSILDLKKEEDRAYLLRGQIRLENGALEEAESDFDLALKYSGYEQEYYIDIYQFLSDSGYKEEGESYLNAALSEHADSLTDLEKSIFYYYLGEYETARDLLESIRDENNSEVMMFLGKTYEALTDYNYAKSIYSRFLENNENAEFYNQLGLCDFHLQDYEGALEAFQSGITMENEEFSQVLSYNEIVAYEYLGEFKRAAVLMETYLDLYPDDEAAQREYEFLKTR